MQRVGKIAAVALLAATSFLDLKKPPLLESRIRGTNETQVIQQILQRVEKEISAFQEEVDEKAVNNERIQMRRVFGYPQVLCPAQRSRNFGGAIKIINDRFGTNTREAQESEYTKEELESVGNYFADESLKTRLRECPPRIIILNRIDDPQAHRFANIFGEYLIGTDVIMLEREHAQDGHTRIHELVHYATEMLSQREFRLEGSSQYYPLPIRLNEGMTELFTYRIRGETYRVIRNEIVYADANFTWQRIETERTYQNELREALIIEAAVSEPILRYAVVSGDWRIVQRTFDGVFGNGAFVNLLNDHYQRDEGERSECGQLNILHSAIRGIRRIGSPTSIQTDAIARLDRIRETSAWFETTTECRE